MRAPVFVVLDALFCLRSNRKFKSKSDLLPQNGVSAGPISVGSSGAVPFSRLVLFLRVRQKRRHRIFKQTSVDVFAFTDTVQQFQIPIGCRLRGGGESPFSRAVNLALALEGCDLSRHYTRT